MFGKQSALSFQNTRHVANGFQETFGSIVLVTTCCQIFGHLSTAVEAGSLLTAVTHIFITNQTTLTSVIPRSMPTPMSLLASQSLTLTLDLYIFLILTF